MCQMISVILFGGHLEATKIVSLPCLDPLPTALYWFAPVIKGSRPKHVAIVVVVVVVDAQKVQIGVHRVQVGPQQMEAQRLPIGQEGPHGIPDTPNGNP